MQKSHFYTALFLLLPLLYYLSLPVTVGDLAGWTAYGNHFFKTGTLMTHDVYSVLATRPLIYPVFLPVLYGFFDQMGGLALVTLLHKATLLLLLLVILKNSLLKQSAPWTRINLFWIMVSLNGISIYFIDRPALIALLPLLAAFLCIENERFDLRFTGKMAFILFMWVNIHGSWPLLFIMLCWKFLFFTRRTNILKHILISVLLGAVTLINPFGTKIWSYIFETGTISKMRHIDEWNITNFHDFAPQGVLFYLSAAAVLLAVVKRKDFRSLSSPIFPLLVLGALAFRNVGLYAVVLLPFLFKYGYLREGSPRQNPVRLFNLLIIFLVALLCGLLTPYFKPKIAKFLPERKSAVFDEFYQAEFADYIRSTGVKGPILNDWDYGSYLLYSLPNKILIDARNVIYYQNDFERYLDVMSGSDSWDDLAKQYNFSFIMVPTRRRALLIEKVSQSKEWKIVRQNPETTLFQKITSSRP